MCEPFSFMIQTCMSLKLQGKQRRDGTTQDAVLVHLVCKERQHHTIPKGKSKRCLVPSEYRTLHRYRNTEVALGQSVEQQHNHSRPDSRKPQRFIRFVVNGLHYYYSQRRRRNEAHRFQYYLYLVVVQAQPFLSLSFHSSCRTVRASTRGPFHRRHKRQ
jgi:hypothetical protein